MGLGGSDDGGAPAREREEALRRELEELERKLIPVLNQVRLCLGKPPVIAPRQAGRRGARARRRGRRT